MFDFEYAHKNKTSGRTKQPEWTPPPQTSPEDIFQDFSCDVVAAFEKGALDTLTTYPHLSPEIRNYIRKNALAAPTTELHHTPDAIQKRLEDLGYSDASHEHVIRAQDHLFIFHLPRILRNVVHLSPGKDRHNITGILGQLYSDGRRSFWETFSTFIKQEKLHMLRINPSGHHENRGDRYFVEGYYYIFLLSKSPWPIKKDEEGSSSDLPSQPYVKKPTMSFKSTRKQARRALWKTLEEPS